MTKHDEYVDSRECARLLGVRIGTPRQWRYEGKGPPYTKLKSGVVRYKLQDVLAFRDKNIKAAS